MISKSWITIVVASAVAILRYLQLQHTPFANGWDAYYYLIQVRSWAETGAMHSPEASLIYPLMRVVRWCAGGDDVLMYKLTAALLCGVFTWLVLRLTARLNNGKINWLVAALLLFSPHLTFFAAQFPKNLLGVVLLLAYLDSFFDERRRWLPLVWLIINYFGHRFTFGLCVGYGMLWWLMSRALPWKKAGIVLLLLLVVVMLASLAAPRLLQLADLGRLEGVWHWQPQLAWWSFLQSFGFEKTGWAWAGETTVALCCWLSGLYWWKNGRFSAEWKAFWLLSGFLLFPFLEWSLTGLSYRMYLVFVLFWPVWAGFLPGQRSVYHRLLVVALAIWSFWGVKGYDPKLHDPDYAFYDSLTRKVATDSLFQQARQTCGGSTLVIAHQALAEYFTFTTRTDAMPWQPEYALPESCLWRIAADVNPQTLHYFYQQQTSVPLYMRHLTGPYLLLCEADWQAILAQAKLDNDEDFLKQATGARNPSRIRPGFLLRK